MSRRTLAGWVGLICNPWWALIAIAVGVAAYCGATWALLPPLIDDGNRDYYLTSPRPPELTTMFAARGIDPEPFGVEGIHDRP